MEEHRPKKLLGQVRDEIRLKHHRTQQAWTRCVERCIGPRANPPVKLPGHRPGHPVPFRDDHETLITRPRDLQDNATPSGNAMAVSALLKLTGFTNDLRYVDIAHQALAQMQPMMSQYPLGFGQWLQALSYVLSKPREIAIVGDPDSADTQALLNVIRDGYQPFQVAALGAPDSQSPAVPLLQDRGLLDGRPAAYVCRDFTCQAPTTEPEVLQTQLARRPRIVSEA
jgi:uncharacterized protein YyaL (SSP411 family)